MKIIKQGTLNKKYYNIKCFNCNTEYEIEEEERIKIATSMGDYYYYTCPFCKKDNFFRSDGSKTENCICKVRVENI